MTKHLRGDPALRDTPVIFVTAMDRPRDVVEGINAGARYYLTKPFSPRELREKVERALGGER